MIINSRQIAALANRKPKIENRKFTLFSYLRRVRTVLLKHARWRKLTELVTDHVFSDENGMKCLSVMHQKRVADKVRRHHRAPRPGFNRFLRARTIHLVDLLQKMRLNEGSLF
jgi:hypothetical protein